jgi:hypothetical protein
MQKVSCVDPTISISPIEPEPPLGLPPSCVDPGNFYEYWRANRRIIADPSYDQRARNVASFRARYYKQLHFALERDPNKKLVQVMSEEVLMRCYDSTYLFIMQDFDGENPQEVLIEEMRRSVDYLVKQSTA